VEALQEGDGDEDNDGLLAVADLDLIAKVHVRISVRPKKSARTQIAKNHCAPKSTSRNLFAGDRIHIFQYQFPPNRVVWHSMS
jgi:hypothetical protein